MCVLVPHVKIAIMSRWKSVSVLPCNFSRLHCVIWELQWLKSWRHFLEGKVHWANNWVWDAKQQAVHFSYGGVSVSPWGDAAYSYSYKGHWRILRGMNSSARQRWFTWKPPVVKLMAKHNVTVRHRCSISASPVSTSCVCLSARRRKITSRQQPRKLHMGLFKKFCLCINVKKIYDQEEITITGFEKMQKSKQFQNMFCVV